MALSPFVFIGVGGSGGKTLRVIHEVLSNILTEIDYDGPWPEAWQFLHIEVAAAPDGMEPGLPFTLPLADFLPLTTPQSTYRAIDRQVSNTHRQGVDHYLAWDSWRPFPPEQTGVTISMGAGQYRAVGRVAVLNNLSDVGAAVARVLADATKGSAALQEIQRKRGTEDLGTEKITREPVVMVVASLSGGSGSGALLDVCDVVRSFRTGEQSKVTAVVYAPEVFERKDGTLEPGIAPNTFVALNELLNASWVRSTKDLPTSREVHFSRSSVNPHIDQTGPDMVYLVGRRNASVTLGNTSEIYRVMGRSLAELALNEAQQDRIGAYAIANAENRAGDVAHTVPLAPRQKEGARTHTNLYALGFARLSLGREYFTEYAAQRLAREAVIRLRDGHRDDRQEGDRKTDDQLAQEYAEKRWPAFIRDSQVDELGDIKNDVINAILPPGDLDSLLATWATNVLGKFEEDSVGIEEARRIVATEVENALGREGLIGPFRAEITDRAIAWRKGIEDLQLDGDDIRKALEAENSPLGTDAQHAREGAEKSIAARFGIQRWLTYHVMDEVSAVGLKVSDLLLEQLTNNVRKAADELKAYSDQRIEWAINEGIPALPTRKPNEPRKVDAGVKGYVPETLIGAEGNEVLRQLLSAEAEGLAAELMRDLADKLLRPLRRGLRDSADLLRQEVDPASGQPTDFTYWPGATGIPEHLRPGRVERTLDDIDTFPSEFNKLLQRSTSAEDEKAALRLAVAEIIRGARVPSNSHPPVPYAFRGRWVPEAERLRRADERGATAVVDFRFSLEDLLKRARAWVNDSEKAIGRHVHQTLAEYLTDEDASPADRVARRTRLTGEFAEMLRLSQPLIKIDTNAYQLAHGDDEPPVEVVMSPLNIPHDDRKLIAELKDIAQGILHRETDIPIGQQRGGTQVMTRLTAPVHPVAVQSIMEPIYTQWASDHLGRTFWSYRRSRPLLEWVPMSPDAQLALAEGWVSARLLGYAQVTQNREDNKWAIRIKTGNPPSRGRWVTLSAAGPRAITRDDALGNVFELVAMATMEIYRDKSLAPLEPFQALVDLGSADWQEHWLRTWVLDGEGIDQDGQPNLKPAETVDERRENLLSALKSMEDRFVVYTKLPSSGKPVGELQRLPRIEIARIGLAAIDAIRYKLNNDDDLKREEGTT